MFPPFGQIPPQRPQFAHEGFETTYTGLLLRSWSQFAFLISLSGSQTPAARVRVPIIDATAYAPQGKTDPVSRKRDRYFPAKIPKMIPGVPR